MSFDLATDTGVAVGCAGGAPVLFTETMGKGLQHGARFAALRKIVGRLITEHGPDLISIEQPIVTGPKGGRARVELAFGYRAAVLDVAYCRAIRTREYAVGTVRAFFIGDGSLTREKAKPAVFHRAKSLGWNPQNDNESDAGAVWELTCQDVAPHLHSATPLGGLF